MVASCENRGDHKNKGCYSLAYIVQKKAKNPDNSFANVYEYHIERGCQADVPMYRESPKTASDWETISLNEKNFGIHGTVSAKFMSTSATADSTALKKLNFPQSGSDKKPSPNAVTALECFEEIKVHKKMKKEEFKKPLRKVRCALNENYCFSRVAHYRKNSDTYVQFAERGCTSKNQTLLNQSVESKPYWVKGTLPEPYQSSNVTYRVGFCKSPNCNDYVQSYTTGAFRIIQSSLFMMVAFLLILA